MQVGLVTGKETLSLVDMPDPVPEPGKSVVEIAYCGICGTDLHAYLSGAPYNPAICGHEWVGHISANGPQVTHVKEGDRVAIGVASACGQCKSCQAGRADYCELAFAGAIGMGPLAASHGGFASAIAADASRLYHVPKSLSDTQAGLLEPATVAMHALRRTPLKPGDNVVVLGAGPIGLLVMQAARVCGAGSIVVVEPEPGRQTLARTLGAQAVVDPNAEDMLETMTRAFHGAEPDVVFECAGIAPTIQSAVNLVRRGGIVALVGVASSQATIEPAIWLAKEVTAIASIAYLHEDFEITKELVVDGRIQTDPLHTSTVGLADLEDAFNRLSKNPSEVKILVDPRIGS